MTWGRLDDMLHQNGKVATFSHEEFRLWMYSISFGNAKPKPKRDGVVAPAEAQLLCRLANVPAETIDALVAHRGWDLNANGWVVHDFDEYKAPEDKTAPVRMRRYRERKGLVTRNVTPTTEADAKSISNVTRNVTPTTDGDGSLVTRFSYGPVPVPVPEPVPSLEEQHPLVTNISTARPRTTPTASVDDGFNAFWSAYPYKVAKTQAHKAWPSALKRGVTAAQLVTAARNYAIFIQRTDQKMLHPATFLGPSQRWEDYIDGVPAVPHQNGRRRETPGEQMDRLFGIGG